MEVIFKYVMKCIHWQNQNCSRCILNNGCNSFKIYEKDVKECLALLLNVMKKYTLDQIFSFDEISTDYKHIPERTYFQRQKNMVQNLRLQKIANFYNPPPTISQ